MGLLVWFTIFYAAERFFRSKDIEKPNEVDCTPSAERKGAPWPLRKGGIWLKLYKNSLTISLFLLAAASFVLHVYGSLQDANTQNRLEAKPIQQVGE